MLVLPGGWGLWVFTVGAVIGSFLNVCIYRLPLGRSVVRPASHCPHCQTPLRWYHNIPLLSFVFLRGRCAFCHAPLSWRYPLVELTNALLYLAVFALFGWQPATLVYGLFVSSLLVVSLIDLDHQIIPDRISLPGVLVGFLASLAIPWLSWQASLVGILLGGGSLYLVAAGYSLLTGKEGMGGGDIKLLAMIGAFLGWRAVFPVIFFSSLLGTLVGIPLMLLRRQDSRLAIPFGPFLSLAAIIYLFYGQQLLDWYLGLLVI
ncbi:prepilin peptidase [Desulfuromonas thiophila]|uniref:Prepilin leader peptidase/N-methyltransferase n=1 Tax=Desulfuromonas thiophila TaxID=57664 RepID=A0A1G7ATC3_9BACT|nr:A24 family peptidase [Desulfuromonas thiophila]SDE18063.1 type 4 prepilin peptidase 1 Aspartic peptidase. MEROPS family A24A [Desulfuromonas thiophila]